MSNAKACRLRTRIEARRFLEEQGITIAKFARTHGLKYHSVQTVLSGRKVGKYGDVHKAAVLLGMKRGVIVADV